MNFSFACLLILLFAPTPYKCMGNCGNWIIRFNSRKRFWPLCFEFDFTVNDLSCISLLQYVLTNSVYDFIIKLWKRSLLRYFPSLRFLSFLLLRWLRVSKSVCKRTILKSVLTKPVCLTRTSARRPSPRTESAIILLRILCIAPRRIRQPLTE